MGGPVKALVFTAPGQVELLDVPEPDPAPGEALHRGEAGAAGGRHCRRVARPGRILAPEGDDSVGDEEAEGLGETAGIDAEENDARDPGVDPGTPGETIPHEVDDALHVAEKATCGGALHLVRPAADDNRGHISRGVALRRIVTILICAVLLAACGDSLDGIGDLSRRIVHGDEESSTTTTEADSDPQLNLTGLTGAIVWVNDEFAVEPGLLPDDLVRRIWLRGDGISPYVQAGRHEIAAALPGIQFPRLIPNPITHISSQLVFDTQTGTLDVSTAAAFGLWTAEPYTVPRTEGQLVVLRVGLKTLADDAGDGEIFSFRVAEGRELSWGFGDHVYQLFCRTGVNEEACFAMAGSISPLAVLAHIVE